MRPSKTDLKAAPKKMEEAVPEAPKKISNNQKQAWQRELQRLESDISILEEKIATVAKFLSNPANYDNQAELRNQLGIQERAQLEVSSKMARWEELSTLLSE